MALTRARVVSGPPAFAARVEEAIRAVLCRQRDPAEVAADVVEMRRAIAKEKGEDARWDLKYAAGGLVDLEFIAQYLQLVHAAEKPEILDTNTARVLRQGMAAGASIGGGGRCAAAGGAALSQPDADPAAVPARAVRSEDRGRGAAGLLCRAADLPNFATLDAHLAETRQKVRASFNRILARRSEMTAQTGTAARFFTLSISDALRT